jgi:hypothetical protein
MLDFDDRLQTRGGPEKVQDFLQMLAHADDVRRDQLVPLRLVMKTSESPLLFAEFSNGTQDGVVKSRQALRGELEALGDPLQLLRWIVDQYRKSRDFSIDI